MLCLNFWTRHFLKIYWENEHGLTPLHHFPRNHCLSLLFPLCSVYLKLSFLPTSSNKMFNGDVQTDPKGNLHLTFVNRIPWVGRLSSAFTILTADNRLQLVSEIGFMNCNHRRRLKASHSLHLCKRFLAPVPSPGVRSNRIRGEEKTGPFSWSATSLMQRGSLLGRSQKWLQGPDLWRSRTLSLSISLALSISPSLCCIYVSMPWNNVRVYWQNISSPEISGMPDNISGILFFNCPLMDILEKRWHPNARWPFLFPKWFASWFRMKQRKQMNLSDPQAITGT